MAYKRILLKISGEQLAGEHKSGINHDFLQWLSKEIKDTVSSGTQVVVVVGGGNYVRGAALAAQGIEQATAHYMGMLATVINGMAMMEVLEAVGQPTRLQTNLRMNEVAEPFIRRQAISHLEKKRVVVIAAGLGKPFITTDTAAVSVALELGCDIVMKATKVNGVYDSDPAVNPEAKLLDVTTYQTAIENPAIRVMDKAAIGLAMEQHMPILVFNVAEDGNLQKAANGESIGTLINH